MPRAEWAKQLKKKDRRHRHVVADSGCVSCLWTVEGSHQYLNSTTVERGSFWLSILLSLKLECARLEVGAATDTIESDRVELHGRQSNEKDSVSAQSR